MKRMALVLGAVVAMFVAGAGTTKADDYYGGYNRGFGVHGGHNLGYSGGYGTGHGGFSGGYGGYARNPVYHDTTHYDYHRPSIQFHRGHIHVTPGHYDLHRTGHWDR